jgi:MFS family permease
VLTDERPAVPPAPGTGAQRRTLAVLTGTQVLGGVGVATGVAVSTLVAADLSGSESIGGLAQTSVVLGAALMAVPTARLADRYGRRPALTFAYGHGMAGAVIALVGVALGRWQILLVGLVLFGGGSAANLAARYSATDLSRPGHAARDLSVVVWATTLGSVAGPNLASPADLLGRRLGLADAAGPYALAAASFAAAALGVLVLLRPDPLRLARAGNADAAERSGAGTPSAHRPAGGRAWRVLRESPAARVAVASIVVSHTVMVAVMSMTPVHLHHGHASLTVVGIVISLHIAGMYALSPLVGRLTDQWGRIPVLMLGMGQLAAAAVLAGMSAPQDVARLSAGLVLLGTGWSCGLVAGSALLTESVPLDRRPAVQGLSDLLMNGGAALGGVAAGVIVMAFSYGFLAITAATLVLPMLVILLSARAPARAGT